MAGEIEAFGQVATAGLAAASLDGSRGPRRQVVAHHPTAEPRDVRDLAHGACANCATVLTGPFCAGCGQSAHVHRSIGHVVEEFLHGVWHFDSKAWATLPRLVFRPGRLTRDYVFGRRAAYIAPLAMFLFSVFLMFFVFGLLGGPDVDGALRAANARGGALAEARSNLADARGEVGDAIGDLADAKADDDTTAKLATLRATLAARQGAVARAEKHVAEVAAQPVPAAVSTSTVRWQDRLAAGARNGDVTVDTGLPVVDERIRQAMQSPDFALYRIEQKAYKLSFLLIPMSLPLLWLLFARRRGVHTYDHVVFALYSLSFMSLLFIVIALATKLDPTSGVRHDGGTTVMSNGVAGTLLFAAPVHMFFQLKGAYRLTTGEALWRTAVLAVGCAVVLALFATLIVVVGLAD